MRCDAHTFHECAGLRWLAPEEPLGGIARLVFTTRAGGHSRAPYESLNLAQHVDDVSERVRLNRRALLAALGAQLRQPVALEQVHGTRVAVVGELHAGTRWEAPEPALAATDGLVTAAARLPLTVLVADCLPVALADPEHRALAVVHAGWRGLANGILEAALERLAATYGTRPEACAAWLGPAIGPCCYEVGEEVAERFPDAARREPDGAWRLDLPAAAARRLGRAGLPETSLRRAPLCTACHPELFFSHRRATRAGEPATGRQALLAWLE